MYGANASRTLPTICDHMCRVSQVSCQEESGRAGQQLLLSEVRRVRWSSGEPPARRFLNGYDFAGGAVESVQACGVRQ